MLKSNDPREQLEFLKREEVRTMAKDVAFLREAEARKERERIMQIKTTPESQPVFERSVPPPLMPHAQEQKPVFLKARTRSEKILIRVIVIGILLFILLNGLAFGYWYFTKKRVVDITPQATPEVEEPIVQPSPAPSPVVFFETLQKRTIELGETEDLLSVLSNVLKEEHPQGFTRILLKKQGENTFLTTREFLARTNLAMPEPLLSLLKEDFLLFVYSLPGRKRLGFIGELSRVEGAQDILRSWETTLEQDTKPFWEIVGQKGSAYTALFRQAMHQNNAVRFQTFSVIDFGIVYTIFGTKLILTTSFESLTRAVDQMIQSR